MSFYVALHTDNHNDKDIEAEAPNIACTTVPWLARTIIFISLHLLEQNILTSFNVIVQLWD